MLCPFCQHDKTEVFNSRGTARSTQVWRRRRCKRCQNAFTTYEAYDLGFLDVRQRDASTLPYSRARLFSSIYLAFVGSELSSDQNVDNVTATIEHKLQATQKPLLHRDEIIAIVVASIRPLSITATMRYLADHPPTGTKNPSSLL